VAEERESSTKRLLGAERSRSLARDAAEVVVAVAVATGAVAALEGTTPASRLEVLYLLAVLAIAIRRGEIPALITAVLSGLALNFFFIAPRHQLTIAHSQDVVELVVLMIAAVVVGRLAATARQRAAEGESRAREASLREREATLVAGVASAILAGQSVAVQLESIGLRVARATGASRARVALQAVPSPGADELTVPLRTRARSAWLYISRDTSWTAADLERMSEPLGRLVDVAIERDRIAEAAAETEAARRADVSRTAILHAVSHDFRSPLTAITTAGSALRSDELTEDDRSELIEVIESEAARLAELMADLLDLSRIQAGAVSPQADWCDLQDVVASAAAHLATSDRVEFVIPAELPLVRADAAQLERVFSNLLENALKFSPPEEPVRVTAGAGGGRVTVRVIDQGRGIPAKDRARVFEPFFRVRGSSGSGSGLGLAICRGFVEANGGSIVLQSGAGRGTAFAVSFPIAEQPVASVDSASST
jgi:two-component system, OmpR family, sensor histidine kinase KdpD